MESLPTELLASSLSYLDYRHALRMVFVSRRYRESILPDAGGSSSPVQDFWRSLCKSTFRMDDARFREWPNVACWRDMYLIVHRWGRREGFYTLDQALPWGLLCLFHLEAGKFVGEVLTPCSFAEHSRRLKERGDYRSDGVFDREVFFEATFCEGGDLDDAAVCGGQSDCQLLHEGALGEDHLHIIFMAYDVFGQGNPFFTSSRPWREENIVLVKGEKLPAQAEQTDTTQSWPHRQLRRIRNRLLRQQSDPPNLRNLGILETLSDFMQDEEMQRDSWSERLDELVANEELEGASAVDARRIFQLWRAQDSTMETILGAEIIDSMWNVLDVDDFRSPWRRVPKMLNFQYVDGPSHKLSNEISFSEDIPIIRPGLYCGSYHPEFYHKYCEEILLVEYRRYTGIHLDGTWDRIHAEVFNSQHMHFDIRETVVETGSSEVLFVVGRKVTGDMHVPAGKVTFGALVHPLLPNPNPELLEIESTRSSDGGEVLQVLHQWHGFGTLASPLFRNPMTTSGILLQLENDSDGNHRFGFLWERSSNETIVLKRLPIQDKYPWFHR